MILLLGSARPLPLPLGMEFSLDCVGWYHPQDPGWEQSILWKEVLSHPWKLWRPPQWPLIKCGAILSLEGCRMAPVPQLSGSALLDSQSTSTFSSLPHFLCFFVQAGNVSTGITPSVFLDSASMIDQTCSLPSCQCSYQILPGPHPQCSHQKNILILFVYINKPRTSLIFKFWFFVV